MSHRSPWFLRVGTECAGSVLADNKTWRGLGKFQLDDTLLVGGAVDVVCFSILRKLDLATLCVEVDFGRVKAILFQGVRGEKHGFALVWEEDSGVELRCRSDTSDVTVDDLDHTNVSVVGHDVKCLGFDVGGVHYCPFHVVSCELGVRSCAGLFGDGLNS